MTLDLGALLDPASSVLAAGFLVFLRVGAAMALLPAFGEMVIPMRVRFLATLAFVVIILPSVELQLSAAIESGANPLRLGGAEVMIGLLLGFSLRLLVVALHVAASIAAQATSLSQLLGGASIDPQPAIGMVMLWAALAAAVSLGLHVRFAALFMLSYDIFGPAQFPAARELATWLFPAVARTFEFAFLAASPFVAVSLMYNLTLGVINKAMPQLMVAFVGAPAITFGALALFWLVAPVILSTWLELLDARIASPFGVR